MLREKDTPICAALSFNARY